MKKSLPELQMGKGNELLAKEKLMKVPQYIRDKWKDYIEDTIRLRHGQNGMSRTLILSILQHELPVYSSLGFENIKEFLEALGVAIGGRNQIIVCKPEDTYVETKDKFEVGNPIRWDLKGKLEHGKVRKNWMLRKKHFVEIEIISAKISESRSNYGWYSKYDNYPGNIRIVPATELTKIISLDKVLSQFSSSVSIKKISSTGGEGSSKIIKVAATAKLNGPITRSSTNGPSSSRPDGQSSSKSAKLTATSNRPSIAPRPSTDGQSSSNSLRLQAPRHRSSISTRSATVGSGSSETTPLLNTCPSVTTRSSTTNLTSSPNKRSINTEPNFPAAKKPQTIVRTYPKRSSASGSGSSTPATTSGSSGSLTFKGSSGSSTNPTPVSTENGFVKPTRSSRIVSGNSEPKSTLPIVLVPSKPTKSPVRVSGLSKAANPSIGVSTRRSLLLSSNQVAGPSTNLRSSSDSGPRTPLTSLTGLDPTTNLNLPGALGTSTNDLDSSPKTVSLTSSRPSTASLGDSATNIKISTEIITPGSPAASCALSLTTTKSSSTPSSSTHTMSSYDLDSGSPVATKLSTTVQMESIDSDSDTSVEVITLDSDTTSKNPPYTGRTGSPVSPTQTARPSYHPYRSNTTNQDAEKKKLRPQPPQYPSRLCPFNPAFACGPSSLLKTGLAQSHVTTNKSLTCIDAKSSDGNDEVEIIETPVISNEILSKSIAADKVNSAHSTQITRIRTPKTPETEPRNTGEQKRNFSNSEGNMDTSSLKDSQPTIIKSEFDRNPRHKNTFQNKLMNNTKRCSSSNQLGNTGYNRNDRRARISRNNSTILAKSSRQKDIIEITIDGDSDEDVPMNSISDSVPNLRKMLESPIQICDPTIVKVEINLDEASIKLQKMEEQISDSPESTSLPPGEEKQIEIENGVAQLLENAIVPMVENPGRVPRESEELYLYSEVFPPLPENVSESNNNQKDMSNLIAMSEVSISIPRSSSPTTERMMDNNGEILSMSRDTPGVIRKNPIYSSPAMIQQPSSVNMNTYPNGINVRSDWVQQPPFQNPQPNLAPRLLNPIRIPGNSNNNNMVQANPIPGQPAVAVRIPNNPRRRQHNFVRPAPPLPPRRPRFANGISQVIPNDLTSQFPSSSRICFRQPPPPMICRGPQLPQIVAPFFPQRPPPPPYEQRFPVTNNHQQTSTYISGNSTGFGNRLTSIEIEPRLPGTIESPHSSGTVRNPGQQRYNNQEVADDNARDDVESEGNATSEVNPQLRAINTNTFTLESDAEMLRNNVYYNGGYNDAVSFWHTILNADYEKRYGKIREQVLAGIQWGNLQQINVENVEEKLLIMGPPPNLEVTKPLDPKLLLDLGEKDCLWGIQGDNNFFEAIFSAMLLFTDIFDSRLLECDDLSRRTFRKPPSPFNSQTDTDFQDAAQRFLTDGIANTLRKYKIVPQKAITFFMIAMERLCSNVRIKIEMDSDEDTEEMMFFLGLFNDVLNLKEFIHYKNLYHRVCPDYIYVMKINDCAQQTMGNTRWTFTTVQLLIDNSFALETIKMEFVPLPALILKMPPKVYQKSVIEVIVPNLELDITDLLYDEPRLCFLCEDLATRECLRCLEDDENFYHGMRSAAYCEICCQILHASDAKMNHIHGIKNLPSIREIAEEFPPSNKPPKEKYKRVMLKLSAVICVCYDNFFVYVRSGEEETDRWLRIQSRSFHSSGLPEIIKMPKEFGYCLEQFSKDRSLNILKENHRKCCPELKEMLSTIKYCIYCSETKLAEEKELLAKVKSDFSSTLPATATTLFQPDGK